MYHCEATKTKEKNEKVTAAREKKTDLPSKGSIV